MLLVASTVLLVVWAFAVPIFEAPDEPHHWEYARYMHYHWGGLPIYGPNLIEANQPPLYYWLIAPVASTTDLPASGVRLDANGNLQLMSPPRFYLNSLADFGKYWPLRCARLVTVLLSIVTVIFTYLAGYECTGSSYTGLLAASLVLFLPQFTFRGTNISNDAMVASTSAAATYFIVRLIRRGFSWKTGALASLCVAVAFLSKISAAIFVPVLAVVLISGAANWRVRLNQLSVLLIALLCVFPWLVWNQVLYGDPVAGKAMLTVVPTLVRKKSIWSPYFATTFPRVLTESFIGVFGWMNVYLPDFVYWVFGIAALFAAAGLCRSLVRSGMDRRLVYTLAALPILAVASTAQLNLTFEQPQGRYLFPALTALMVLSAIGLERLPRWNRRASYFTIAVFGAINVYALVGIELPNYWRMRL
jgi:4-amino-4-deoxy-L-arabinose transferase-like glycosyltransferase